MSAGKLFLVIVAAVLTANLITAMIQGALIAAISSGVINFNSTPGDLPRIQP